MARRLRFNFSLLIWGFVLLSSLSLSIYLARELIHVGTSRQSPKPHEGTIRIATIDWVGYYPLTAAYAAGYLREELAPFHSDVELIKLLDTGEMSDYVRAGRVHGSFGVLTDYVIMLSMDIPVRMVLVSDFSKTDMLISKKNLKAPKDLVGKTIGLSEFNSFAEYFIARALEHYKVNPESVQFKTVQSREVPEAVMSGKIDAGHTWEPDLSRGLKMGLHVVMSSAVRPEDIISGMILRREVLMRPELARGLLRGYFRGLKLLNEDPKLFAELISRFYGTPLEDVRRIIEMDSYFLDLKQNFEVFQPGGLLEQEIQSIHRFFLMRGIRHRDRDPRSVLDPTPLRQIYDESLLIETNDASKNGSEP